MRKIKCPHCGAENDVGSKTCDDCGRYMNGAKRVESVDIHRGRCSWESDGMRCANAGTFTDSTTGSDTWYCAGHHGCTNATIGHQIVLDSLRRNPMPDFSLEARREMSYRKVERSVPEFYRGWKIDEYRKFARQMILSIKAGGHKQTCPNPSTPSYPPSNAAPAPVV